jgi:hypothetical protein
MREHPAGGGSRSTPPRFVAHALLGSSWIVLVTLACATVAACASNGTGNASFACGDGGTVCNADQYCVIYQASTNGLSDATCPVYPPSCSDGAEIDPGACGLPPEGRFVYCVSCY